MRMTIHLVSKRDFPLLSAAVREARREWWLRYHRNPGHLRRVESAARRLRELLADGPRRRDELVAALEADSTAWNGVGLWVDLVRAPPSGTWKRRRADIFALADDWLGPSDASPEGERSSSCAAISAPSGRGAQTTSPTGRASK
jgi:hypothetical protein